jgi:hypothetical protein
MEGVVGSHYLENNDVRAELNDIRLLAIGPEQQVKVMLD